MIDEKKIEVAAAYYAEVNTISVEDQWGDMITDTEELYEAYKEGAHWAINEFLKDLWHSGKEEPDLNKDSYLLVQFADKSVSIHKIPWIKELVHNQWEGYDIFNWLYLDDLFPKKGGKK